MFGLLLLKECDACFGTETRLFTDSWTGLELCIECLIKVLPHTTLDPEDGDNLKKVLREALGDSLAVDEDEEGA